MSGNTGLRVLVDAYWWVTGPPSNRHVLRETVFQWLTEFPSDRLVLMVRSSQIDAVRAEMGSAVGVLQTPVWPHGISNMTSLTLAARRWRPDVVYSQNFSALGGDARRVAFVHDVLWATNPEWFTALERLYFTLMSPLARQADLVLTSSATEADRIRRVTRAKNVVPVGIGMSTELQALTPVPPKGMPPRFLLTVGRLNIRKNLAGVIAAALASGVLSPERPLLVVGKADGKGEALSPEAQAAVRDGFVRFTGHVTDAELIWLYSNTDLFVFLSRGEGYGMPPVEAMYFDAPVLVSDIDVFREILPAEVSRVAPDDIDGAGRMIARIVGGQGEKARLTDPPSWVDTVRRTRDAITSCGRRA